MGMIGTFDGFTASRLGIYAAQQALRVTGNNISNINTAGYTRQRVDQMSFKVGANDMYRSYYDNHIGSGALVTNINQIRDPYLDIRYRTTCTETYHYDTWLSGLQEIASILDEVGKGENGGDGLLYKQLQDLAEKLRSFSANPTNTNDGLVRESASALASLFRNYAGRLQQLYDGTVTQFQNSITDVNDILVNIRDLNKSIREAELHGDNALEMRDERNRQIDALSQYIGIKVEYSYEDVGAGIKVEKLTIKLNNTNPDPNVHTDESVLVDGLYATQLSLPEELPVLNTYGDQYGYLEGFKYLKKIPMDGDGEEALLQYLEENNLLPEFTGDPDDTFGVTPPLTTTDDDGNMYFLVGTNDPNDEDIVTKPNDNFTIQLGKLLDAKGREWKNSTTTWEKVEGQRSLTQAVYQYPVTINIDSITDDLTFNIKNGDTEETYTIKIGDIENVEDIVAYIAQQLEGSEKYPGYHISSDGMNIVFEAISTGEAGVDEGAPDAPALTVEPSDSWLQLEQMETVKPGYEIVAPEEGSTTTTDADGTEVTVAYTEVDGKWYKVTLKTEHTREITLDDNDLRGILQAQREMLTEEGEFSSDYDVLIDEEAAIKRGIPYYQQALDLLAQKLAEEYNKLNQGYMTDKDGYYIDANGKRLQVTDADGIPQDVNSSTGLTDQQRQNLIQAGYFLQNEEGQAIDENGYLILDENGTPITIDDTKNISPDIAKKIVVDLEALGAVPMGGPLFSNGNNGNDTSNITAKNIDISSGWSHGAWGLVPKFEKIFVDENNPDGLEQSTQNTNADRMLALIEKSLKYNPNELHGSDATGPLLFEGSFNDFLSYIMSVEASDARVTNVRLNNAAVSLTDLDYSREGVSGVDLNDEAMNMVQYQKAMNAAMRVMTVIDEVLDRLINNTGVAGR